MPGAGSLPSGNGCGDRRCQLVAGTAERVTTQRPTLDMATGELLTEIDFEPKPGLEITISVLQFACRTTPALLCQEITLASDSPTSLKVLPKVVTREYLDGRWRCGCRVHGRSMSPCDWSPTVTSVNLVWH